MKRLLKRCGKSCANGFCTPEEVEYVRWYDILWLIIPIAGIAMFVAAVSSRARV
tara:strand:+ start:112 stop:273 length:162 start_codon:yes stop_codon:yes gene_type:complete